MAKLIFSLLFFATCFCCYAQTGKVILNVQNIKVSKSGEISAGIFKKEDFPKVGQQFIGNEIVFENVPVGTYALVVFQDIDKDKKLKSNLVGFQTEPIGFSRDAKIKFGPPDFDDAKVEVQQNKTLTLTIILK